MIINLALNQGKQNIEKGDIVMKRTFGKNIVLFILIVLFTLCMAVGCTTLNANPVADTQPANSSSSISLGLSSNHLLPGETVDLIITAKLKNNGDNSNDKWGSADFYISSKIADKLEVVNVNTGDEKFNKGTYDISGDFALESKYDPGLNVEDGEDFLHFVMPGKANVDLVSAQENLVIKIRLKLATDATKGVNLDLFVKDSAVNAITAWGYSGDNDLSYNGGGGGLDLTNATISAEVRDPEANTDIEYIKVVEGKLDGTIGGDKPTKFEEGSIGMSGSASLGDGKRGFYEAIHGSAPDIAGKDIANPIGMILSVAMMLRHSFDLEKEAASVEKAIDLFLQNGYRTQDIMKADNTLVKCSEAGDLICEYI